MPFHGPFGDMLANPTVMPVRHRLSSIAVGASRSCWLRSRGRRAARRRPRPAGGRQLFRDREGHCGDHGIRAPRPQPAILVPCWPTGACSSAPRTKAVYVKDTDGSASDAKTGKASRDGAGRSVAGAPQQSPARPDRGVVGFSDAAVARCRSSGCRRPRPSSNRKTRSCSARSTPRSPRNRTRASSGP